MPDAQKELIFGREEVDPPHHGSGLSLFFTDNVIRSYDGEIWVEDNDPRGAVFRIRLMKPQPDERDVPVGRRRRESAGPPTSRRPGDR